ncbi:hypothetical protein VYU27_008126 [Nannochloropsis oceanica]
MGTPRLLAVARLLVLNPSFRCASTSATAACIFPVLAAGSGLNVTAHSPSVLDDVVTGCCLSRRLRRAAAATSTWPEVDDGGRMMEEEEKEKEKEKKKVDLGPEQAGSTRLHALNS